MSINNQNDPISPVSLTWEDFQKQGDALYKEGNIAEANIYWDFANKMRPDTIGKQMDIINATQQINKKLAQGEL